MDPNYNEQIFLATMVITVVGLIFGAGILIGHTYF